jgi:sorting nexin-1/2
MQLDAEEDDNIFYKPPVEPSAQSPPSEASQSQAAGVVAA